MREEWLARLRAANTACADFLARAGDPAQPNLSSEQLRAVNEIYRQIEELGHWAAQMPSAEADPELRRELAAYGRMLQQMLPALEVLQEHMLRRQAGLRRAVLHAANARAWARTALGMAP